MLIVDLQSRLTDLGFDPGPIDGKPGGRTTAGVKAFQKAYGLVVDGVVGPQTIKALTQATTPVKPGRAEPDKSAIGGATPASPAVEVAAATPPNRVILLDTVRPIRELIWHCAATPEGRDYTVADVRAWHKARGWSDIGYHFVVYRDGRIMVGRPIGQIGAHVTNHNTNTVGCSYIGGLSADGKTAKDTRTAQQRASMLWLTAQLATKFPIKKVSGHNEYAAKACPSFHVPADQLGRVLSTLASKA